LVTDFVKSVTEVCLSVADFIKFVAEVIKSVMDLIQSVMEVIKSATDFIQSVAEARLSVTEAQDPAMGGGPVAARFQAGSEVPMAASWQRRNQPKI
jgi:hypothetical protein